MTASDPSRISIGFCTALLMLVAPATGAVDDVESGAAIIRKLRAENAGWGDWSAELEMEVRDAGGGSARRTMRLKSLEAPEGAHSLLVLDAPADVRGTALLSRAGGDAQQFLFLPATKRVRRITGGSRAGSFLGSEIAYEDLVGVSERDHRFRARGEAPCGATTCVVVEATPLDAASAYTQRLLFLEKAANRLSHVEFYDRRGGLLKTLRYSEYEKFQSRFWRAKRWTMTNEQTGRVTVVTFTALSFGKGLSESDFTQAALSRLR